MLALMLVQRLTVTRHGRRWRFHGTGSLQPLVEGLVCSSILLPPTCGSERFEHGIGPLPHGALTITIAGDVAA